MRNAVGFLVLLAGCGGLSETDRALLDGPRPAEVPGAWVVWSARGADGAGAVYVVERDGRVWSVERTPDVESAMQALLAPGRKVRLVEQRREGALWPADVAFLDAALRSKLPEPSGGPGMRWDVVVREPDQPERRFSYEVPFSSEEPRALSGIETARRRVLTALPR